MHYDCYFLVVKNKVNFHYKAPFNILYYNVLAYYVGICEHGDVRLTGSSYTTVGQIEVCINGSWGTICSDNWRDVDASVVCKYLGFTPHGKFSLHE